MINQLKQLATNPKLKPNKVFELATEALTDLKTEHGLLKTDIKKLEAQKKSLKIEVANYSDKLKDIINKLEDTNQNIEQNERDFAQELAKKTEEHSTWLTETKSFLKDKELRLESRQRALDEVKNSLSESTSSFDAEKDEFFTIMDNFNEGVVKHVAKEEEFDKKEAEVSRLSKEVEQKRIDNAKWDELLTNRERRLNDIEKQLEGEKGKLRYDQEKLQEHAVKVATNEENSNISHQAINLREANLAKRERKLRADEASHKQKVSQLKEIGVL